MTSSQFGTTSRGFAGGIGNRWVGCAGFRTVIPRRRALQVGAIGGLGLSLGDFFRLEARGEAAGTQAFSVAAGAAAPLVARAKSVIHLNLPGGFPHHDSFDPKPEAPVDVRGMFGVEKTNTGEVFSDNLTKTAKIADKLTVVRSVVGRVPDHGLASYHLFKAYPLTSVIDYPSMGSVVAHELGGRGEIPPFIAVPAENGSGRGTGFLSTA